MNAITNARADLAPTVQREDAAATLSRVILEGDLSRLSDADRVTHYNATCQSIGLNPLTRPLEYIKLNGKLVLYARKDCTDQLRAIRRVSVTITDRTISDGLAIVTARASTPDGRTDEDIGSVPIGNLAGEARANAIMKAMTKAKRRVTLSICGLGFLDESEVDSVVTTGAATVVGVVTPDQPAIAAPAPDETGRTARSFSFDLLDDQLSQFIEVEEIRAYLAQPKVQSAHRKVMERGQGERWAEIVQRHYSRVLPADETEQQEIEQ
jgi:hypothetical protein